MAREGQRESGEPPRALHGRHKAKRAGFSETRKATAEREKHEKSYVQQGRLAGSHYPCVAGFIDLGAIVLIFGDR